MRNTIDSYYFSFEPTGNDLIDGILKAVADAGRWLHHTRDWGDKELAKELSYEAPEQLIQQAANNAAKALNDEGWHAMELAPRDGTMVDIFLDYGVRICNVYSVTRKNLELVWIGVNGASYHDCIVTHWRPLPEPPKG